MRLNLLPRERRFYTLFERNSDNPVSAVLGELLNNPAAPEGRQDRISELEHEADEITHDIVRSLNRVFVTPSTARTYMPWRPAWTMSSTSSRRSPTSTPCTT